MKKLLPNVLFAAVLLFGSGTMSAQYVTPISILNVPAKAGPVTIDGTDDGYYSPWMTTMICKEAGTGVMPHPGDSVDFNVRFKLTWDYTYLYLLADIVDDVENDYQIGKTSPGTWDNIEVFIDLDTNSTTSTYSTTSTTEMRFCRGLVDRNGNDSLVESNSRGAGGAVQSNGQNEAAIAQREQYKFFEDHLSTIDGKKGWHFEVAIPWSAATDSAAVNISNLTVGCGGTVIGFDIGAADSDGDPNATGNGFRDTTGGAQSFWDLDDPRGTGNEDNASKDRLLFGFLSLTAAGGQFNCTGLHNAHLMAKLGVIPNPATTNVKFTNLEGIHSAHIYNILGRSVKSLEISGDQISVDISDLPGGVYIFKTDKADVIEFIKE